MIDDTEETANRALQRACKVVLHAKGYEVHLLYPSMTMSLVERSSIGAGCVHFSNGQLTATRKLRRKNAKNFAVLLWHEVTEEHPIAQHAISGQGGSPVLILTKPWIRFRLPCELQSSLPFSNFNTSHLKLQHFNLELQHFTLELQHLDLA